MCGGRGDLTQQNPGRLHYQWGSEEGVSRRKVGEGQNILVKKH